LRRCHAVSDGGLLMCLCNPSHTFEALDIRELDDRCHEPNVVAQLLVRTKSQPPLRRLITNANYAVGRRGFTAPLRELGIVCERGFSAHFDTHVEHSPYTVVYKSLPGGPLPPPPPAHAVADSIPGDFRLLFRFDPV